MIGGRAEVGLVERHGRTVQIDVAADATQAGADRMIDRHGLGPGFGIAVADLAPAHVGMKGTADAGALGRDLVAVPFEPAQAVLPRHALFDERPAVDLPRLERRLNPHQLVERNADPLLDDGAVGRAAAGQPDQLANLPADRDDLVVLGALAPDHPDFDAAALFRAREGRDRSPALAAAGPQEIGPDVPGRDDMHWEGQHVRRHQPGEMLAHGARLPAGVGEDGAVGHRPGLAVGGHQRQRGRLDARAQAEHAQSDPIAVWGLAKGDEARQVIAGVGCRGGKRHRVSPRRAGRGRSLCLVSPSRPTGRTLTLGALRGVPAEGVAGDQRAPAQGEASPNLAFF